MPENRQPGKLAVIVHADIAGSTLLVQQDEHLAHERIQDTFQRFSDTITQYNGHVRELRGDALLAEFERPSDSVTAALAFQAGQAEHNAQLSDDIRPTVRVGIAMGEVIIDERTVTGAGVVLAQRVEQLAEPGGTCITAAIHESVPQRMPFNQENLGERQVKGFKEPVHVYRVHLTPGQSIPPPERRQPKGSPKTRGLIVAVAAVTLVVIGGAVYLFKPWVLEETSWSTQFPKDSGGRGFARSGVKLGRLNLRLEIPSRWGAQVIEEKELNLQGFDTSRDQLGWETARELDGTINPQVLVATDREEVAHFRVFKLYKYIPTRPILENSHKWFQNRGIQLILDRYAGTSQYDETRGPAEKGLLGSGEELTLIPSLLQITGENRYVWIAYVNRSISSDSWREYIVFFFHNGKETKEIDKDLLLEITKFATKMF